MRFSAAARGAFPGSFSGLQLDERFLQCELPEGFIMPYFFKAMGHPFITIFMGLFREVRVQGVRFRKFTGDSVG